MYINNHINVLAEATNTTIRKAASKNLAVRMLRTQRQFHSSHVSLQISRRVFPPSKGKEPKCRIATRIMAKTPIQPIKFRCAKDVLLMTLGVTILKELSSEYMGCD